MLFVFLWVFSFSELGEPCTQQPLPSLVKGSPDQSLGVCVCVVRWGDLSSYPLGVAVSFFCASQKLQAQSWSLSLGRSLGGQLVKSVCEGARWLV